MRMIEAKSSRGMTGDLPLRRNQSISSSLVSIYKQLETTTSSSPIIPSRYVIFFDVGGNLILVFLVLDFCDLHVLGCCADLVFLRYKIVSSSSSGFRFSATCSQNHQKQQWVLIHQQEHQRHKRH